jgi:type II secretory pathway predicted ATPase ExeA
MKITQVTVSAGRVIPHPMQDFANLRPSVQLVATVEDGEDAAAVTRKLQAQAEQMVEDHKDHLIDSIHRLAEMSERDREISQLEKVISTSQDRLAQLREHPELRELGARPVLRAPRSRVISDDEPF